VIGLVGHLHLHQHIAGEEFALGVDLLAAADLDDVLSRNQDFREGVFQALLLGLVAQLLGDLLLEVRIGVDDVPLVAGVGRRLGRCIGHVRVSFIGQG